jgi:hypothetical protein
VRRGSQRTLSSAEAQPFRNEPGDDQTWCRRRAAECGSQIEIFLTSSECGTECDLRRCVLWVHSRPG